MSDFSTEDRWLGGTPSPIQENHNTGRQDRWVGGFPAIIQQIDLYTGTGSLSKRFVLSGTGNYTDPVYSGSGSLSKSFVLSGTGTYSDPVYNGDGDLSKSFVLNGTGNYTDPVYSGDGSLSKRFVLSGTGNYTDPVYSGDGDLSKSFTLSGTGTYSDPVYIYSGEGDLSKSFTLSGIGTIDNPVNILIEPTGGVELGGRADGVIDFTVTKEFSFNSGQCVPYYWQVFGKCEKYSCLVWSPRSGLSEVVPEGGPTTDDCDRTLSITIQACSIVEVCRELSSQGFQFTIDKIYKYTRPALERDQYLWDGCGAFVEIYPNPDLNEDGLPPECLLFLIRETIKDDWGINFQVEFICNIDGEGGLDVGGEVDEADVSANVYFIDGDGWLNVGESIYNFVGTFDNVAKTQSEVFDFEVQMKESQGSTLVASDDLVSAACDCGPYLLLVSLTHNLNDCDKLKFFLNRNGFILPSLINLVYNNRSYAWQSNFHFSGLGESDSLETWDFVFEWACTDEIGMITVDKIWKFGIYIKQRIISTNERFDTKILLAINPVDACNLGRLKCSFALNTELETINTYNSDLNINANLNVCYDGMGIFSAPSWLKDPTLDISIYQQGSPQGQGTFSINPILPESVIFG